MHYLYTDGSHANELNIAAIGGYLLDSHKKEVWSFSNPLYQDQPYHELKALDYALVRCLDDGIRNLTCYTDSLNIVRDIGKQEAKHNSAKYHDLFNNVLKLLPEFKTIEFEFIPREQNKKANFLARKVLTHITSQKSRVDIYQSIDKNADYFRCEKLFCVEQFIDKKKINSIRDKIHDHYVFDLYRGEDNILEGYRVYKSRVEQLFSYPVGHTWSQYLNAISQTLEQVEDSCVGIMVCPANNEIDLVLRGMKAIDPKYAYELSRLQTIINQFKYVLIDSDNAIYQEVFKNLKNS